MVVRSPSAPSLRNPWRRFLDWLLLGPALRRAREQESRAPRSTVLGRAQSAIRAADCLMESGAAHHAGAISLYREALVWLLSPAAPCREKLDAAFDAAPDLTAAAGSPGELAWLRSILVERDFAATAELSREECHGAALRARAFAHTLLARAEAVNPLAVRQRRRWRVAVALATTAFGLAGLLALTIGAVSPKNLAENKPWRTSSAIDEDFPSNIFFHTNRERDPWLTIDLGAPKLVHKLAITNRSDCAQERARPLLVELSLDDTNWHEVARNDLIFSQWNPSFRPETARYVRVRIPRVSALHLEKVKVF